MPNSANHLTSLLWAVPWPRAPRGPRSFATLSLLLLAAHTAGSHGAGGYDREDDGLLQSLAAARQVASSTHHRSRKPPSVLKGTGEGRLQWPRGQVHQDPPAWYV